MNLSGMAASPRLVRERQVHQILCCNRQSYPERRDKRKRVFSPNNRMRRVRDSLLGSWLEKAKTK